MHNMQPEHFILGKMFTSFNFSCSFNRTGEYRRVGTHFNHYPSFVLPFSSHIQQPHTLNKVQYPADKNAFKAQWFHKMMTQVNES